MVKLNRTILETIVHTVGLRGKQTYRKRFASTGNTEIGFQSIRKTSREAASMRLLQTRLLHPMKS